MTIPLFPKICGAGRESHTSPSYFWNNHGRYFDNRLVLQLTLEGACFFENQHGRKLIPPGHAMLFTYDESSSYGYPQDAVEPYSLVWMNLLPSSSFQPIFTELKQTHGSVIKMDLKGEACSQFLALSDRYQNRNFRDFLHESDLIFRLFHAISREQTDGVIQKDPIAIGHDLIHTRYRTGLNIKTIAAHCGISREHFIRQFCLRYGMTPAVLLRTLRLEHAREALTFSQLSVETIASGSGFTSSSSFCRAFRREYGISPLDERERKNSFQSSIL